MLNRVDSSRIDSAMDGSQPEIEKRDAKFFLARSGNTAAGKSRRRRSNRSRIEREGSRMSGQQFSRKWLAGALGLALAFGVGGYAVARAKDAVSTTRVHASLKLADPSEGPSKTGFAPVVKEVLPNVVNISSSKVVKQARNQMQMPEGMENDPFFQQFFGQQFGGRGRGGNGGNGNGPDMPQKQREQS